ncbi:MAG TPA: penicillin-binding protein 2 [Geobacteraceae bacterium]|nr:penicillin-binding protein 2 [Geobacteraceae bacterium]
MSDQRYVRGDEGHTRRILLLNVVVCAVFFVLLTRLWYLQIIQSEKLKELSESNRLRLVPVAASRGKILDRNGEVLVNNTPSFSVAVIPQDVKDKQGLLAALARHLHMESSELLERWEKGKGRAKYYPVVLASGITRDQLEYLEENRLWLPGLDIEMKPVREYPSGLLAAHLLGHLGEISEQEMSEERFREYNLGDYVGKSGIERTWEHDLHGVNGGRQIEVDARGRFLRSLSESRPMTGNSLILTIDRNIQKSAEQAFGDKAGAAVVMEVGSGEILAFASNPSFDPALFSGRMPPEIWNAYLNDKRHPLENKALKGQYPPGSTFKIITALAALEEGIIDADTTFECKGSYTVGNNTFRCWNKHGHGRVNLKKALKESCDVYFYHLAERLGVDRIARTAREFGLGEALGIGLDSEKSGLIPTAAWKEKKYKKSWYKGETLPVAIGQGFVLMTPIQLASMISTVANEGTVYRPHLVKRVVDPEGKLVREFAPEIIKKLNIPSGTYRLVKEGLLAVVNESGGTGGAARLYEVKVAGKTGTSQVVKLRDDRGAIPYEHRDHALFVAFAPYEKPEVAVAVVIEHGEHGGAAAAPIAGRILRAYFEGKGVIRKPVPSGDAPENEGDEVPEADTETGRQPQSVPGN